MMKRAGNQSINRGECRSPLWSPRGFTLIELMIVAAIVAIVSAIAYPAYTDSVRKSRRADAKAAMLENAQFMERVLVENKTYQPGGATPTLPITQSPKDGGATYYDLTLSAATAITFTLRAAPKGAQASDKCGKLELMHTGQKGIVDSAGGMTVADCW